MEIKSHLRHFIRTTFLRSDHAELADDAPLISSGLLDSTDQLELVLFLESDFGITVGEDEAGEDHLDTLERIEAFVTKKQGEAPPRQEVGHAGGMNPDRM